MYAPWIRCRREEPTGEKSMSPWPSSVSAPFWSRITRESVCDETENAIRLAAALAHLVHLDQVARARERHVGVALLHLAHEVLERDRGLLRRRDDGREQVRDRVVVVELDLLGVDQHEPDLARGRAEQDRGEHRVDAAGLARAGRAGDE